MSDQAFDAIHNIVKFSNSMTNGDVSQSEIARQLPLHFLKEHLPVLEDQLLMVLREIQDAKKGWKFNMSFYGSINSVAPGTLVELFTRTRLISSEPRSERAEQEIRDLWSAVRPRDE